MRVDKAKLRAYLDGELSAAEREGVEQHLADSPQAQVVLTQLRQGRDQINQALHLLAPTPETVSPAWWALKRIQARLNPDSQVTPSLKEKSSPKPAAAVWESPSLLTEIKTDFKKIRSNWRQFVTKGFVFATIAGLMVVVSAIAFALWSDMAQQVAEQVQQVAPSEIVQLPVTKEQGTTMTTVIVALQPIGRGSEFVPGSIGRREWSTRNLPTGFIAAEAETIGKVARTNIVQGQVIVRGMLVDASMSDTPELPPDAVPISAVFNNEIELIGYQVEKEHVTPNDAIDLTLYWRSLQAVAKDYTVFIHLADSNGLLLGQEDSSPVQGKSSTSQWQPGQVIEDSHHILTAENLPVGKYDLVVGLYNSATQERLSVQSESNLTQDSSLLLTKVQVGKIEAVAFELKGVRKLTPCENRGRNHIFIKVQDASGQGINGVPVKIQWGSAPGESVIVKTETKDNEPGRIDFAMFAGFYSVEIQNVASQVAGGLTPNYGVDEPCGKDEPGNSPYHESFEVIFQQTTEVLPAVPFSYGIQADPNGDTELNISSIQELGFGWVKFQMPWKAVEPTQGNYDWATWDEVIGAYSGAGIKVMLSVVKAPDWARPADDDKSVEGPPADPTRYANFVARVADRYRGKVQAIEIWNEQNLWYEAGGKGRINAASYVELLQLAYQAIKSVNQDMMVISGALTPAGNIGDLAIDDVDYLKQMYANGIKGYFDLLGAHPAGYNCPATADWRTVTPEEASADPSSGMFADRHHSWCFLGTLEAYREVMVANDDGDKAIAPTEFGWAVASNPSEGYKYAADNTRKEQAQWIVEAYQWAKQQGWVGPMILWNLDYSVTAPYTELSHFGILYTPAYEVLVKMPK